MTSGDDEIALVLEKLKWLRLPGMASALRTLLEKAACATRRRPAA